MEEEQPWEMSEGGTVEHGQANRLETVHAEGLCSSRVGCASEPSVIHPGASDARRRPEGRSRLQPNNAMSRASQV